MHDDIVIIGVAGGSASGKTTVANRLKQEFAGSVELISHDCYYKAHDDMPFEERCKLNYDHPTAFDTERLIHDIQELNPAARLKNRFMTIPSTTGRRRPPPFTQPRLLSLKAF